MGTQMAAQKAIWLVKSGGQVIGPFTERQVGELLRDRVVAPLDEITAPAAVDPVVPAEA